MAEEQKIYGSNRVFCGGRLIGGPDARSSIASLLMICAPSILWQIEVGSFLAERWGALLPFAAALLQCAALGLLLATAFSDPGILPRQEPFTEQYDAITKGFRMKQPPRYYDVVLRGHSFKLKYCTTCYLYRPPRCTHCSVCENCVERFDHHCPWIGNCVGKRNYWLFYSFVSSTAALNVFTLATSIIKVAVLCSARQRLDGIGVGPALLGTLGDVPVAAALVVYSVGIVWFTVGLCLYHTYLIGTNQTTYEQVKGAYSQGQNPFHRGLVRNFQDVLGSAVRPRYFNAYTGAVYWPPSAPTARTAKPCGQERYYEEKRNE